MLWLLVAIIVTLLFYYCLIKPQYYWRDRHVKQGPPIPILGDSYQLFFKTKPFLEIIRDFYNRFPDVRYWGMNETMMRTLIIRDPDLIKQITVNDFDHFTDHRSIASDSDVLWSKNLFALKGDLWRDMRATFPSFNPTQMRPMFTLLEKSAQQYVDYYLAQDQESIDLNLKDSLTRFANDVIANCAFGVTVDSLKEPINTFYLNSLAVINMSGLWLMVKSIINMISPRVGKFLGLSFLPTEPSEFFKTIILDAVKLRDTQVIVPPDVIHLMMEARDEQLYHEEEGDNVGEGFATVEEPDIGKKLIKPAMTDVDIAAQVMIFFFAGFDTISTTLSFLCYELAVNQEVQKRLRQEIDWFYAEHKGKMSYNRLRCLMYLDMVVSETLRKYPPFGCIDRVCTKPYTIQPVRPDEHPVDIHVGQSVYIPIVGIHHDEKYYPNPMEFNPERFHYENKEKENIRPYTFLPFGAGPRNCVGSGFALFELKTWIFHVLCKFELTVIDKTKIPVKYDKVCMNPSLGGGFWVGLKRRGDVLIENFDREEKM